MLGNLFSTSLKDSINGNPSETSNIDLATPEALSGSASTIPLTGTVSEPADTAIQPSGTDLPDTEEPVPTQASLETQFGQEGTAAPIPELEAEGQSLSEMEILKQELSDIKAGLFVLQETFDQKIKADTKKNEQFDKLHEELQDYRNGTFEKTSDAIALEIIRLIDELGKDMTFYAETAETDAIAKALHSKTGGLRQELLDILYRQGIEPYQEKTETLDSHRQTNVQTITTEDAEKHRTIAERVADGFEKDGRVIRKERVKVYRAVPPKTE